MSDDQNICTARSDAEQSYTVNLTIWRTCEWFLPIVDMRAVGLQCLSQLRPAYTSTELSLGTAST